MRGMFIFLFFQVVAAHEPSKFPETRSKVSTVTLASRNRLMHIMYMYDNFLHSARVIVPTF